MTCAMLGYAGLGAVRRCRTTNTQSPMSPPLAWYPSSHQTRAVRDVPFSSLLKRRTLSLALRMSLSLMPTPKVDAIFRSSTFNSL